MDFDNKLYYLGSLCRNNHDYNGAGQSLRYFRDNRCVHCTRERQKRYSQENPDKIREKRKRYQLNKPKRIKKTPQEKREAYNEYQRRYRQKNIDAYRAYQKRYRQENSEYYREYNRKYQKQYALRKLKMNLEEKGIISQNNQHKKR